MTYDPRGQDHYGTPPRQPEHDDSIQPVVRRRRLRSEFVVIFLGLVFVAGAVAKPWGGNPAAARTTIAPTAGSTAGSTNSARPSQVLAGPARAAPAGHPPSWADVSWTVLKTTDPHAMLGISTVGLTVVPYSGPYQPDPPRPQVSWNASPGNGAATIVTIPASSYVFAIAATWPRSLAVSNVSVAYATPGETTAGAAAIPILPVPANEVVLAAPSAGPSLSPVRSGQFWIAPSGYPIDIDPSSLALVWQLGPWSWPMGQYQITLSTSHGPIVMNLLLQKG